MVFRSLLAIALPLSVAAAMAQRPTATFIGNCAFRFELEGQVFYTDFPYEGGYAGYDAYDAAFLKVLPGTALITHAHRDHFDASLHTASGLGLVSPELPKDRLDAAVNELGERTGIYVYPRTTTHADVPHFSYLVQWNGRRLYFTGDTEDPADLLATRDIDVAYVTPWIIEAVRKAARAIDARTVVMYHHRDHEFDGREVSPPCDGCKFIIPERGDVMQLFR